MNAKYIYVFGVILSRRTKLLLVSRTPHLHTCYAMRLDTAPLFVYFLAASSSTDLRAQCVWWYRVLLHQLTVPPSAQGNDAPFYETLSLFPFTTARHPVPTLSQINFAPPLILYVHDHCNILLFLRLDILTALSFRISHQNPCMDF
jgi:hypothetical protein